MSNINEEDRQKINEEVTFNLNILNKDSFLKSSKYINVDKEKVQIINVNAKFNKKPAFLEVLTFYKKNNFFNPLIMEYERLSDDIKTTITLESGSMNNIDVNVYLTSISEVTITDPKKDLPLRREGFGFKHQIFFNSNEYFGFHFNGNLYSKENFKIEKKVSFSNYKKMISQNDKTFFVR